jgi:hypothetical protein
MRRLQIQVKSWFAVVMWGVLLTLGGTAMSVAADPLTPPPGLAAPEQPISMPAFSLEDTNGATVHSADLQGKVAVLRFWATW